MARRTAPATTISGQEARLISMANDLAEKQLADGTASPSVISYYLRLGSPTTRLEVEKLERENELLKAKTDNIYQQRRQEELIADALSAMKSYKGIGSRDYEDDDY